MSAIVGLMLVAISSLPLTAAILWHASLPRGPVVDVEVMKILHLDKEIPSS